MATTHGPGSARPGLAYRRARSYEVVRTAHLERAHEFVPASILFERTRYDFDRSLAEGLDLHQVGVVGLAGRLLRSPLDSLEVNEPLQLSGLPRSVVAVAAVRCRDALARRRTRISSYAIENLDPFSQRPRRMRSRVRRRLERRLATWVSRRLDRIAFGTPGSRDLYAATLPTNRAEAQLVPAVPAACTCPAVAEEDDLVLYVGALQPRKGVPDLLAAWPAVRAVRPTARLVVVGKGELADQVAALAAARPEVELVVDPPRSEIHRWLRRARVLVLFSRPTAGWKEQVGLPIVEALSHGCEVVTSDETGLAAWLAEHGHHVLPAESGAEALAEGIVAALDAHRNQQELLDALPVVDGRRLADDWLMSVEPGAGEQGAVAGARP